MRGRLLPRMLRLLRLRRDRVLARGLLELVPLEAHEVRLWLRMVTARCQLDRHLCTGRSLQLLDALVVIVG